MTIIKKTYLRCDSCKVMAEAPHDIGELGFRRTVPGFEVHRT